MKLWIQALAGAFAWFASLCASFAFAPWACSLTSQPVLYAIPLMALLVTAVSAALSWKDWRQLGREFPGEAGGAIAGSRAMASGGVLLNGLFVLVILAQLIVPVVLGACE